MFIKVALAPDLRRRRVYLFRKKRQTSPMMSPKDKRSLNENVNSTQSVDKTEDEWTKPTEEFLKPINLSRADHRSSDLIKKLYLEGIGSGNKNESANDLVVVNNAHNNSEVEPHQLRTLSDWQLDVGLTTLGITVFLLSWMSVCYCEHDSNRGNNKLISAARRRQAVRDAVRSKIALMEGIEDAHSMRWYMEQREPIVHFGGVVEISPEQSTIYKSVTVLYEAADAMGTNQLKRLEVNLQEILDNPDSERSKPLAISSSSFVRAAVSTSNAIGIDLRREREVGSPIDVTLPIFIPADFQDEEEEKKAEKAGTRSYLKMLFCCRSKKSS